MSLWRSADTSDFSAIACFKSNTVLSVDMVIWSFSSLGPVVLRQCMHLNVFVVGMPLTFIWISEGVCWESAMVRRQGGVNYLALLCSSL